MVSYAQRKIEMELCWETLEALIAFLTLASVVLGIVGGATRNGGLIMYAVLGIAFFHILRKILFPDASE